MPRQSAPGRREGTELMSLIEQRKSEHIDVVLNRDVRPSRKTSGFESLDFEHVALPEMHLDDVRLGARFLGRDLKAPLLISSMTGGPERASSINRAIAEAAGKAGIAFGVGSQRIALEGNGIAGFDRRLRDLAGPVPILANFGAAQLAQWDGVAMAHRATEMIDADALIIHLNPLQEAVQVDGDRDWSGLLAKIAQLARTFPDKIVVKEIGFGISGPLSRRLWEAGVHIIDVAGAGGTNWAMVEAERARSPRQRAVAAAFSEWGVPTAQALVDVRATCPEAVVIVSGGIRDGVDAAKAIRLGADIVGQAAGVLPAALAGAETLFEHIQVTIDQLKIACFCTGSPDLQALRQARLTRSKPSGE
jgi:isopentenyl-diphosphate Delta-isomerase